MPSEASRVVACRKSPLKEYNPVEVLLRTLRRPVILRYAPLSDGYTRLWSTVGMRALRLKNRIPYILSGTSIPSKFMEVAITLAVNALSCNLNFLVSSFSSFMIESS